jgi:hypothetical protein
MVRRGERVRTIAPAPTWKAAFPSEASTRAAGGEDGWTRTATAITARPVNSVPR